MLESVKVLSVLNLTTYKSADKHYHYSRHYYALNITSYLSLTALCWLLLLLLVAV